MDKKNDGLYTRVTYAFFLGLFQTIIALVLEVMSIYYLCAKSSFRLILMSYATMACIAAFDDLYSKTLGEHPLHSIVGKKIPTTNKRFYKFQGEKVKEALEIQG